jgi:hypothetical protein
MKLLFLSADNLRNGPLIKDLVYNYKNLGKSLILHDHFGSVSDTRFVTKRLSALMSEEMIVNNAFSGDQRSILSLVDGHVKVRAEFLKHALDTVELLLLNPLGLQGDLIAQLDPAQVLAQLRHDLDITDIYIFPKNVRSPLVAMRRHFAMAQDIAPLRDAYEEESAVLDFAEKMLPVVLAAPGNFKPSAS